MTDDPMTPEEIVSAREWIGLGNEKLSDAEIVDGVKDSLWLWRIRTRAAYAKLASTIMIGVREDIARLRTKMVKGKD